ncbi:MULTISPECIES: hypothetical protein [unclassified Escherichia]|nr:MULTISPECIES: hypothetical protein [unclassified Escherichia]
MSIYSLGHFSQMDQVMQQNVALAEEAAATVQRVNQWFPEVTEKAL